MGPGNFLWLLWQLRERRVRSLKRPSSPGRGRKAEDPVGREPWTRPAVAMGTAGRRRRAEAGGPAGQFRVAPANGREWPRADTWGRVFPAVGAALMLPSQTGETTSPLQPSEPPPT